MQYHASLNVQGTSLWDFTNTHPLISLSFPFQNNNPFQLCNIPLRMLKIQIINEISW